MGGPRGTIEERLWRYISPEPNSGCWLWDGAASHGYGILGKKLGEKRTRLAHRLLYQITKGNISEELDLDHLCRNTFCVNPDHLEPVTHKENMRRGKQFDVGAVQRARTHCPQGHEYTEKNTYTSKTNQRYCRSCQRAFWSSEKRRISRRVSFRSPL